MNGNEELEKRLRAMLRDRAGRAPSGDGVIERVLAEAAGPPSAVRRRRSWGTWTMPLLAAAAVVAVIASVLAVSNSNNTATPAGPSIEATHSDSSTGSRTPPEPKTPTSAPAPFYAASAPTTAKWDQVGGGQRLTHFRVVDATFLGTKQAWLLGTADCLKGRVQPPCDAMVRTDDSGATWQSVPPPGSFDHIRFANTTTGYAFSPSRLDMTTNGTDWVQQAGGAVALETLDNNVIRVAQRDPSCVGACTDFVETSAVGSTSWTRSKLGPFRARAVELQRTHGHAFLLVRGGNPAGHPRTSLFSSDDGGMVWQRRSDGCTKLGSGFAAFSMAVGPSGASLHLLCRDVRDRWAIVSVGRRGTVPAGVTKSVSSLELGAADQGTLFLVADGLYRSADGGQTWHAVLRYAPKADLGPPEFENAAVGRWFTDGGRVVWTTTDSGRTWHGVSFSS